MDILYYSNYCPHSQRVLQYIVKAGLTDSLNCICIDNRVRTPSNQWSVITETGTQVHLPPNVVSVPSLILVRKNYTLITGDDIITHLNTVPPKRSAPGVAAADAGHRAAAFAANGEPVGTPLISRTASSNIASEQYTMYDLSPDQLAGGYSAPRDTYHYMPVNGTAAPIHTPDETYTSDKVSESVTIDMLQRQRDEDVRK